MTHDQQISSYIDNELSSDQEQEFLISLAASDGLRKTFRSELVMKNVLHRDEAMAPRNLRAAVFGAVGLAGAGLAVSDANAAGHAASPAVHASSSLLKTLFATKLNALITVATISLSGLGGFGVHALVAPGQDAPTATLRSVEPAARPATTNQVTPPVQTVGVSQDAQSAPAGNAPGIIHQRAQTASHKASARVNAAGSLDNNAGAVNGAAGGGPITVENPVVQTK